MIDANPSERSVTRIGEVGLRVQGRLPKTRGVAIVGSRRASRHGRAVAAQVAGAVVRSGGHVVSGGAYGIDIAAHRGALEAGGATVVVLGSGLDHPTPTAHRSVYAQVAQRGALVSMFPDEMRGSRWTFPKRNRVIALLSAEVVVVQATRGSGSLYTARAGLEQGKRVWVVPGGAEDPLHAGCRALVAEGARLYTPPVARAGGPPVHARGVWDAAAEPATLEQLAERAQAEVWTVAALATDLELDGWLVAEPGGRYRRVECRR